MKTRCPHCKAEFKVPDEATGRKVKCPKCGQPFTIAPFDPAAVEVVCTSCKAAIGPQEQAFVYKNNVVCKRCYNQISERDEKPPARDATTEKKPKSEKLSKAFYVYCWLAVRIAAGIVCLLGLALVVTGRSPSILSVTFISGGILAVCSVLIELALYYKMWSAIYDDKASTSPIKAIAFLFIPIFNIYWALYMLVGFAEDYNAFIQRNFLKAKSLSVTLFLMYAAAFLLSSITVTVPMVGMFALVGLIRGVFVSHTLIWWFLFSLVFVVAISHFIIYTILATKTCNAINALDLPTARNGVPQRRA